MIGPGSDRRQAPAAWDDLAMNAVGPIFMQPSTWCKLLQGTTTEAGAENPGQALQLRCFRAWPSQIRCAAGF
jgi:hypothetical protein